MPDGADRAAPQSHSLPKESKAIIYIYTSEVIRPLAENLKIYTLYLINPNQTGSSKVVWVVSYGCYLCDNMVIYESALRACLEAALVEGAFITRWGIYNHGT
ncbi:hypothetical protein MCJ35_10460 [Enterocloster sp. OA13]|uniref:Uncharacterized protein n=1 Tax=Enterocloster hominis (ex Hitch et al. 2024) TaxID=1917870 RepID=A0ABV1DBI6_9FIRM|nr:hypothetical protein [Enterocloster sp. OA13]